MPANFPDCPIVSFIRSLKATKALRGIEILVGSRSLPTQTAPGRIVIWPTDGQWDQPADATVSLFDIQQQVVAELWGMGSAATANPDEAALQDLNATWALLVAFEQALSEQGENPTTPSNPGAFWQTVGPVGWDVAKDTTQQGTSVKVLCEIRCAVPAASDDEGHVGDNWTQGGPVVDVAISGAP